jgi:hypothetical protein
MGQPVIEVRNLVEGLLAYPNPANNNLRLNVVAEEEYDVVIQWTDLMGRVVWRENRHVIEGESTVWLESTMIPDGLFVLSVIYPEDVMSTRVVVRH